MIPARKSAWFERVFAAYNRNLLRRRFERLRVAGLQPISERPEGVPLILYANHSSWWDGLIAFELGRAAALDQYVLMEERQLASHPLFRRLGAFSVSRERPREAYRSIEYASRLLVDEAKRGRGRALWIFPQGASLRNDVRPLKLYSGAARIIERVGDVHAVPVAVRYEFLDDFRPEAFVRFGAHQRFVAESSQHHRRTTERLAETLTRTLDQLRADVLEGRFGDYEELVGRRR